MDLVYVLLALNTILRRLVVCHAGLVSTRTLGVWTAVQFVQIVTCQVQQLLMWKVIVCVNYLS